MGNRQELERVIMAARRNATDPDYCLVVVWKSRWNQWDWSYYIRGIQTPRPRILIDVSRGTGRSRDLAKEAAEIAKRLGLLPLPHDMMSRAEVKEAASHE